MITDLTKEHPDKILWRFLLPLMISVIFQQFYNIADSMIAGKFAGESALGAVGASYPITIIYMAFAVGMNLGASVVISRLFGAGDKAGLRRAVSTAFISVLVLSVLLSVFGYFCSANFLTPLQRGNLRRTQPIFLSTRLSVMTWIRNCMWHSRSWSILCWMHRGRR